MSRLVAVLNCLWLSLTLVTSALASEGRTFQLEEITDEAVSIRPQADIVDSGQYTFWLPPGAEELVLPISAGVLIDTSRSNSMQWLKAGSPWNLIELPLIGLRYGDQLVIVIAPWPHYAELIVEDRVGVRFTLPDGRHDAAPVEIVAMRRTTKDPLEVARQFRKWRETSPSTGVIPKPRPMRKKIASLPTAKRLLGAPHIYLWGPALFCRHDVPATKWQTFAQALQSAPPGSFGAQLTGLFSDEARISLQDFKSRESPVVVALAISQVLSSRELLHLDPGSPAQEVIHSNKQALANAYADFVNPLETWGDGLSISLLNDLHEAGVESALLVLSDLYRSSARADVADHAEKLGYLLGPYDSYHSIHSPDEEKTWETAQFDLAGFEQGRVINADGTGHSGFMGRGFHFSPTAAWPYVKERVESILGQARYATWFVDCDATGECFEDYSPQHPTTKVEDTRLRRERLAWLEKDKHLVIGSEGGSVLFSDLIHYGHGVHTPFIVHLDRSFRDPSSPYFWGRHWPPDTPEQQFKATPVPPSVRSPYFDPTVRIPLYQAALGDELINTHHWSMDSLKFGNVAQVRELMEILYMIPPMYHLNRESWPMRRDRILKHLAFWGPLHRELALVPMTGFKCLSEDRLLQQTTFDSPNGEISITVNFGESAQANYPPYSATVSGPIASKDRVYIAKE